MRIIRNEKGQFIKGTKGNCGDKHPNWKGGKLNGVCEKCGESFMYQAMKKGRFCSRKCYTDSMMGITKKIKVNCSFCNKNLLRFPCFVKKQKNFYCSIKCQGNHIKGVNKGGKSKRRCDNCKKEYIYLTYRKKETKFCTHKCYSIFSKGISKISWNYKGGISKLAGYDSFIQKKRELRKKINGGTHTFEEWNTLKSYWGYMCLCCKKKEPEIKLTEDHIIPLSKGGKDRITNIQPLCIKCNRTKMVSIIDFRLNYETTKK